MSRLLSTGVFALMITTSGSAEPGTAYDFYICANVNRDYVIGSEIVTVNGLFRLGDEGEWHHFGVNDTTISALAIDPRDPDILYTTTLNGLWQSSDGGENWRFANSWDMTEGRDVAVDPHAPDTVYLALPDGIAVSTNRAQTLERRETGLPDRGKYTETLEVDRTTAGRVFAGTASGIYLTENHGEIWRRVLPTETTVNDIQQSPHDPTIWLSVTDTDGGWMSRNRGLHWTKIETLPSDEALYNGAFDPTNPDRLAVGSWSYGTWTSEDGGKTWRERNAGLPQPHRVMRVGINPNSGRLYASVFKKTLYYSDDFGRTWSPDALEGSMVTNFVTVLRNDR